MTSDQITALVPAFGRRDSVGATVRALLATGAVHRVVVIDDGSHDGGATASAALASGADVVQLSRNRGKGAALEAGITASPDADIYLLVDADTGASAAEVVALLGPILGGAADLVVGVLPPAGSAAGFGLVRALASALIGRAAGVATTAPLSGQRAIRGDALRACRPLGRRFGVEVAMTIDVVRSGGRLVEVPVAMDHRHTGRSLSGFTHRARQGIDLMRVSWPRLISPGVRSAASIAALVAVLTCAASIANRAAPSSVPLARSAHVVVVAAPSALSLAGLVHDEGPLGAAAGRTGAIAAANVNTPGGHPDQSAAWATVSAGVRSVGFRPPSALDAVDGDPVVDPSVAVQPRPPPQGLATPARSLAPAFSSVVTAARVAQDGGRRPTRPGLLGDAIAAAGLRTALVAPDLRTAVAVIAATSSGHIDVARTAGTGPALAGAALVEVQRGASLVAVDGSGLGRGQDGIDGLIAVLAGMAAGADTTAIVVSPADLVAGWHLQPLFIVGRGAPSGSLTSPSTRRAGLITLADVGPTILDVLGVPIPTDVVGRPMRLDSLSAPDLGALARGDRDAVQKNRYDEPVTIPYIVVQVLVALVCWVAWRRGRAPGGRAADALAGLVVWIAAYPLATWVVRAIPRVSALGGWRVGVTFTVAAAIAAIAVRSARASRLAPLGWVCGATVALLAGDLALGAPLQVSSPLGYAVHTSGRFSGIGNVAFAVLGATAIVAAASHLRHAPRRADALIVVGATFAAVIVFDGAPMLGDDVGGVISLVPLLGLLWLASRTRLRLGHVVAVGGALGLALGAASAVDLARPPDRRTHLGRFADDVLHGRSAAMGSLGRRVANNLDTYTRHTRSMWLGVVLVLCVISLGALLAGRVRGSLPVGSDVRRAAVALLALGIVGNVVNDSGAVVTAIQFVYLCPFLILIALDRLEPPPTLLLAPVASGAAGGSA